jgi:hypothetical protein
MVKRIQCRVISSVPLGKTTSASHYSRISNDKPDPPNAFWRDEFVVEDVRANHTSNSVGYIGWLNIVAAPIDTPAGHIFDYYA